MKNKTILVVFLLFLAIALVGQSVLPGKGAEETKEPLPTTTSVSLPTPVPATQVPKLEEVHFVSLALDDIEVDVKAEYIEIRVKASEPCGLSVLKAVEIAKKVAATKNPPIPWNVWGTLTLTESSFKHYENVNGECRVRTSFVEENGKLVPAAYGLSQIYLKWHPSLDTNRVKEDPEYNASEGANILINCYNNNGKDWDKAVICYKALDMSKQSSREIFDRYKLYQKTGEFKDLATGTVVSLVNP